MYDYDPTDDTHPTLESTEASRRTRRPKTLTRSGVAFNHKVDMFFYESSARALAGRQVLDELFELHCRTATALTASSRMPQPLSGTNQPAQQVRIAVPRQKGQEHRVDGRKGPRGDLTTTVAPALPDDGP